MAAGCPPTYEKFGLSCYKYLRTKATWKMAQEQCMKDGGNLVSVENKYEQAFLVDYLKRHGKCSFQSILPGTHSCRLYSVSLYQHWGEIEDQSLLFLCLSPHFAARQSLRFINHQRVLRKFFQVFVE